ncbi:MAG: ABC transporter permease [Bdellovibrionaceae bacterium]|nr:ABC transporter permease [Pseudobdellovibrionaceae bacterium]
MNSDLLSFFFKRVSEAFLTLLGLVILTFFLMKGLPGGPFDHEASLHPLVREKLAQAWNIDGSSWQQLASYVGSVLKGDLGWSMNQPGRSVMDILRTGWNQTVILNFVAMLVVLLLGTLFSYFGFLGEGKKLGAVVDSILVCLISLPGLFLGPILIWAFAFELNWFPAAFLESPLHYVLPVFTLALRPAASLARLLLGTLRDLKNADFLRTARAKGLSPSEVFWRHALRNSMVPVLTYGGPVFVGILSGSFLIEILFSTRGMGAAFADAVAERDSTVILGLTLVYGALLVGVSFVIDLLLRWVDPRIREVS